MLKKDYKAHVATNKFDLNTLPVCGASMGTTMRHLRLSIKSLIGRQR